MFDISSLFISTAQAAEATAPVVDAVSTDFGGSLVRFLPLFLIFIVFYVLLIRPQQKKLDEQTNMLKSLKKGDKVVTSGGIVGTVTKIDDEQYVMLEVAKDVQIKVVRSTISSLVKKD